MEHKRAEGKHVPDLREYEFLDEKKDSRKYTKIK